MRVAILASVPVQEEQILRKWRKNQLERATERRSSLQPRPLLQEQLVLIVDRLDPAPPRALIPPLAAIAPSQSRLPSQSLRSIEALAQDEIRH